MRESQTCEAEGLKTSLPIRSLWHASPTTFSSDFLEPNSLVTAKSCSPRMDGNGSGLDAGDY